MNVPVYIRSVGMYVVVSMLRIKVSVPLSISSSQVAVMSEISLTYEVIHARTTDVIVGAAGCNVVTNVIEAKVFEER